MELPLEMDVRHELLTPRDPPEAADALR